MLIGEFVALLVTETAPETVEVDAGVNVTPSVAVCPAPIICPAATPDALNPAPVAFTAPIVTVEFPLFVSVTLWELLLPIITLPNARLDVLALSEVVVDTPVPESGIAVGDPEALLIREIDPETAPPAVGANATLNVVLPPPAIVAGTASPLMLNPAPFTDADEIVSVTVPEFWIKIVCEFGDPTITFPKLTLVGFVEIKGCPAATPVPFNATTRLGAGELFANVMLPPTAPEAVGTNFALIVVDPFAGTEIGSANPETENPDPAAAIFEMLSAALPLFEIVKVCVLETPTATFPKSKLVGATEIAGCPWFCPVPVPSSTTDAFGVGELFAIVIPPPTGPTAVGTKTAVIVTDWFAGTVRGIENPDTVNPGPAEIIFEIISATFPLFVIVTNRVLVVPTGIFPKSKLDGETVIADCPELDPVPERAIVETAGLVLAVIEMLPVTAPALLGANFTANEVFWPAFTDAGSVIPLTENPAPLAASFVMVSVAVPVFNTVKVCVADDPVATDPNVPLAPPTVIVVGFVEPGALALVKPVQPTWVRLTSTAIANTMKIKGLCRWDSVGRTCDLAATIVLNGANRWLIITRRAYQPHRSADYWPEV
jgi:hypothetical protein